MSGGTDDSLISQSIIQPDSRGKDQLLILAVISRCDRIIGLKERERRRPLPVTVCLRNECQFDRRNNRNRKVAKSGATIEAVVTYGTICARQNLLW